MDIKPILYVEMNPLFEFYPEVRVGELVIYSGSAYDRYAKAEQDGIAWLGRNGHEVIHDYMPQPLNPVPPEPEFPDDWLPLDDGEYDSDLLIDRLTEAVVAMTNLATHLLRR